MFDDDEYGAPYTGTTPQYQPPGPVAGVEPPPEISREYSLLRDQLARAKARACAAAKAQVLQELGDGVIARPLTQEVRRAQQGVKSLARKLSKERSRLSSMASTEQQNMLAEQGAADELGIEVLEGKVEKSDLMELDAIDLDEDLASAEVSATSFGSYTDRAQYDPKTQMLLDMGYALEDFSVDARLDAQLKELEDMGVSISGDDLYTQSPTLNYAVPSDIADAGMFSADTDFLDSTAPTGLWEDGVVDEFESGDVSMGDAYGASGGSGGRMSHDVGQIISSMKWAKPGGRIFSKRPSITPMKKPSLTDAERARVTKIVAGIRMHRRKIRILRKQQKGVEALISATSKTASSYRRKLKQARRMLRSKRRFRSGPLRGKFLDPIGGKRLQKKIKKLSKGLRNVNKRLRAQNRTHGNILKKIGSRKNHIALGQAAKLAIYAKAHGRAGDQAAAAQAQALKDAAQAEADKQEKEVTIATIVTVAADKILSGQQAQDVLFTKKVELEAEVAQTDLSPAAIATPKVKELEVEVIAAANEADFGVLQIFEGVDAMADIDLSPTFTESYYPTEAGEGGWVDVPEDWDADYYEPEWEDEYEPMEEQQDAAYYAAPSDTESGLPQDWDSVQQRLDDQLAQLAEWGVSISGDSYGVDPWDQFGDDLYSEWPTLDYAVPSDIADAGMFSGDDEFGFNLTSGSGKPFDFSSLGTGGGGSAKTPKGPVGGGGADAPSGDSILGFIGTLANGALNLGASAFANAGKGNKQAGNWGSQTQKNLGKASNKVQNTVASTPTPPPTAAQIAAAFKAARDPKFRDQPPVEEKGSILPWVGVGLAGTAVIGTVIWASTR